MKGLKNLLLAIATLPFMASCLNSPDGFSQSGFTSVSCDYGYANTTKGFAGLYSLGGKWQISQNSGGDWCKLDRMSGSAQTFYTIGITFEPNTTDTVRAVRFVARDVEDDGMASFVVYQFATRGDGSLGSSPLVKTITGDDGSLVELEYDNTCRPTGLIMSKGSEVLHELKLSYHGADSTIAVNNKRGYMVSKYNIGYMPKDILASQRDTVYGEFNDQLGYSVFYLMEKSSNGGYKAMSMLYNEQQAAFEVPYLDREHKADSIKYLTKDNMGNTVFNESLGIEYSKNSNRRQSIDANQLLLGIDNCSPYALLGLYRNTRISYIIAKAKTKEGEYTIEPTLNKDNSVASMTVTNKQNEKVTYTFEYYQ